ncbi:hypothetical protein [Sphingomonas palmae]|uniref:hypothetical protein n=1 Tax=Sphingomonas palmae TaxID=1855283 RepID=UPI000B85ECEA|nr:hypothetical protein [Sphingomonas palmae]
MLADLHETSPENIRSRFRKLRLKPFPDEIRSGTGKRVAYDLPRVLALSAVFELNRLYIPQAHAIEMVENCWPEWCRAFIAAAGSYGLLPPGMETPHDSSPVLTVLADAFRGPSGGPELLSVPVPRDRDEARPALPAVHVETRRIVAALAGMVASSRQLSEAFIDLERAFGWTPPATPHRASVAQMSRGRGFLDEGPYFDRAEAMLNAPPKSFDRAKLPIAHARLQALMAYLERPAPIDQWKAELGDDEGRPRLRHLLSFWADAKGLEVTERYPHTAETLAGRDVREAALHYIATARRGGRCDEP